MRIAGAIIALIAGIFGVFAAGATLFMGGLGGAIARQTWDGSLSRSSETVVMLGWGGVLFSFLTIVLGAVAIGAKSRTPGYLLIPCSLAGAVLGGMLVAIFMALALIGGLLTLFAARPEPVRQTRTAASSFILPPLPGQAMVASQTGFCKSCGKPFDGVQAFCGGCGAPVQRSAAAEAGHAPLVETPTAAVPAVQAASISGGDPLVIPQRRSAAAKPSGVPAAVLVLGVLTLAGGGAAVALMLNPSLLGAAVGPESGPDLHTTPSAGLPVELWQGETPTLCAEGENVSWSCKANGKIYSLCASRTIGEADGYMQYRVGVPGSLEFSYPERLEHPRGHFSYTLHIQGNTSVSFANGGYEYSLLIPLRGGGDEINVIRNSKVVASITCPTSSSFEIVRPDLVGMAQTPYGN